MTKINVTEEEIQQAYGKIAMEEGLTIMQVSLPGEPFRAAVPGHWRDEAVKRAMLDRQNQV